VLGLARESAVRALVALEAARELVALALAARALEAAVLGLARALAARELAARALAALEAVALELATRELAACSFWWKRELELGLVTMMPHMPLAVGLPWWSGMRFWRSLAFCWR
jgi:hypothetical protein